VGQNQSNTREKEKGVTIKRRSKEKPTGRKYQKTVICPPRKRKVKAHGNEVKKTSLCRNILRRTAGRRGTETTTSPKPTKERGMGRAANHGEIGRRNPHGKSNNEPGPFRLLCFLGKDRAAYVEARPTKPRKTKSPESTIGPKRKDLYALPEGGGSGKGSEKRLVPKTKQKRE